MTNKEAIEELENLKEDYWDDDGYGHETNQYNNTMLALDMAIKALEQQPEIIRCKDCKQFRRWVDTDITFCDLTESPVFETDFCSRAESEEA